MTRSTPPRCSVCPAAMGKNTHTTMLMQPLFVDEAMRLATHGSNEPATSTRIT